MAITAGPLLRFSKEYLPQWLIDENPGFEKIRELAFEFIIKSGDAICQIRSYLASDKRNARP